MLEEGKDVTWIVHYDSVHPWTQDPGWDTMEIFARTEEHLTEAIRVSEKSSTGDRRWHLYMRDNSRLRAFLYSPNCPPRGVSGGVAPEGLRNWECHWDGHSDPDNTGMCIHCGNDLL